MTRDMELIRKIFANIQNRNDLQLSAITIPNTEDAILARHLEMLLEAGLIEGVISSGIDSPYPKVLVKDLSWRGHEFAATIENDNVWGKIKESFPPSELRKLPLSVLVEIAKSVTMKWAMAKIGLSV